MASLSMSPKDQQSVERFRREVVEASLSQLVVVRFTATWCGPCKQLAPLIDKAIAAAPEGKVKQVVIDIDEEPMIAGQLRIQSVPTVYAFLGGQPVDGFVGVKSERELKAFIDKLLTQVPQSDAEADIEAIVEAANQLLADGDAAAAAESFAALARELPERADILAGYARALLALGQIEGAAATLATIPTDNHDPAVQQARAALELAQNSAPAGELQELEARIAADPADHDARIALASARFAAGDRDGAADVLMESITLDRDWQDGAARAQLLKFIEAVGLGDPWSVGMRRRLSALLFS